MSLSVRSQDIIFSFDGVPLPHSGNLSDGSVVLRINVREVNQLQERLNCVGLHAVGVLQNATQNIQREVFLHVHFGEFVSVHAHIGQQVEVTQKVGPRLRVIDCHGVIIELLQRTPLEILLTDMAEYLYTSILFLKLESELWLYDLKEHIDGVDLVVDYGLPITNTNRT